MSTPFDSSPRSDGHTIVAIVATQGRPELLSRAVPSILAQTCLPDRLLVVVDRDKQELPDAALKELAQTLGTACGGRLRVTVLRNVRTHPRAAGAWNTGIDQLHRNAKLVARPDLCFVAILDDDDAWEPNHLELCLEQVPLGNLSMVATGLIRHERPDDDGRRQAIPEKLDPRELFIRGQHIQGSNLFVRLDAMLKVGGFDEHLPSCTDRDLCLRLCDLGDFRFGRVNQHTVHHYADPRDDRLSAPHSPAKLDGLTRFWRKYAHRFDAEARKLAAERGFERFGWTQAVPSVAPAEVQAPGNALRRVDIVAGFTTDAEVPGHVEGLLEDLGRFAGHPDVGSLTVVVVENGPVPVGGERSLHRLIEAHRLRGLEVSVISIERQREDWAEGQLIDTQDPTRRRLSIAETRTILSAYLARAAAERPGAWVWVLDDDKRLTIRVDRGDGSLVERSTPDVAALCALQHHGVDVVIGPDTDAPPLPFTATLRVQLVDLLHHVRILSAMRPHEPWADRRVEEAPTRSKLRDYYYDLSRLTEHLETPFTLPPDPNRSTAGETLAFIAAKVDRLLAGEAVFRPLVVDARALSVASAVPSAQRGGSTFFFRPDALIEYPQTVARFGDRYVRRSDMLVTQLLRDQLGLEIVMHASAAVRHDRSCAKPALLTNETLWADVLGYSLYRTADELMQRRTPDQRREPLLAWSGDDLKEAVRLVHKYVDERLAAVTLNGWRIVGLAEAILKIAPTLASVYPAAADLDRIVAEMNRICGNFKPNAVASFAERIRASVTDADIKNAFASMDGLISEYRATNPAAAGDRGRAEARERRARALLKKAYRVVSLRLLGSGGEGMVFTDEERVYKVLDLVKRRPNHDTLKTLRALGERLDQPKHLYPFLRVDLRDETPLLVYPYEASESYSGGRGAELVGLLRECKAHRVVFRNMHPKNLRVSATGLKLVDYGSDIREFSAAGYRSMAERAWLTWRWSHRQDLDQLMRRALTDKTLPELDGFERFWQALLEEKPSATHIVSALVDPIVLARGARRVLDYGCGKKARSARRLADAGLEVVGFDPGCEMRAEWAALGTPPATLELTTYRGTAIGKGPFDAVLCSIVLCEVGAGPAYEQILQDLRAAVADDGIVLITVCNPYATFGGATSLHRRRVLPKTTTYEETFAYVENAESDAGRQEFHRPASKLEADLLRHRLRVEKSIESQTIDLDRFEPASDFLTLVCRPVRLAAPNHRVSLVIKTCAMEAHTIERQVEHLVGQLTGPRWFHERILAIDSLRDGYVRQHATANSEGLMAAARRLQDRGLIDRVVVGPDDSAAVRRLNQDWFGIDSAATHTVRNYPTATALSAFEACVGDYILQVDSDLLIGRIDRAHDYLGEMIKALDASPAAVTASLSIASSDSSAFSESGGAGPWRVEARGSLLHRARLLAARPFANTLVEGCPGLSWHRAMDASAAQGRFASLRGGGRETFLVHPPNDFKRSVTDWMLLLDLVEKRHLPQKQVGKVDLAGGPLDWVPQDRAEPFIFIVTGRNVPPGRMLRCFESIAAQQRKDWGAVIIDDGSAPWARDYLPTLIEPWRDRVTLLQPRERRGQLANMTLAIRHICTNAESVIITLDLDDALLGPGVLDRVALEYDRGADVTVGSMLRTDKAADYPVTFQNPRSARGGNVWQHLRTFRKRLFDAIPDQDLRLGGRYVELVVDWTFMLPIIEMAKRPAWIREPLYLYEPSGMGKGREREERELQIGAVVRKRPRRSLGNRPMDFVRPEAVTRGLFEEGGILFVRHGERPNFAGLNMAERDAVPLTGPGRATAVSLGQACGRPLHVVSSPVPRSRETAEAILDGAGLASADLRTLDELVHFRIADDVLYEAVKGRLGWSGMMAAWLDGSLPPGILKPCHEVAAVAISAVRSVAEGDRVVAVTHDFLILAIMAALHGVRTKAVPYLAGVFVTREEAESFLDGEVRE